MDANIEENSVEDRDITAQLYGGNLETRIQQEILLGIGFSRLVSDKLTEFVYDDKSACAVLSLSIIPYLSDVMGKNAFNVSETLQRYINRCPYKKVFEEWFAAWCRHRK